MDKREWNQIEEIVDEALNYQDQKRQEYINYKCEGDPELKKKVAKYLKAIEESKGYLEEEEQIQKKLLIDDFLDDPKVPGTSLIGQNIGNYQITKMLGYGGLGTVFLAKRADDEFDHRVALKVLRRGMDTPKNISRFQLEREILAELSHPHIAQLYDGGVTDDGLPYLIMEYIDGTPIDTYCDNNKLDLQERLALFKDICKAMQHAHKNLVIHRDLKPANIMVTDNDNVKILDFGIAKLMQDDDSTATQTQATQQMLTPAYAAPEQITYQSITTAIDNYAMGALLYKLLAGITVFDLDEKKRTQIEQIVTKQSPTPPSRRLKQLDNRKLQEIAEQRKTTPKKLIDALSGDLDAIIMKALRKEPEERYESPAQLKEDIRRSQKSEAVVARSGAISYHFSKFVKRNKWPIAAAVVLIALTTGFTAFYTYQISQERDKAQLEAQKAEAVTTFLTDLIEASAPSNAQGDTVTVREFLNQGFTEVQKLEKNPLVKAELLNTMGHTFRSLSDPQKASTLLKQALTILEKKEQSSIEMARSYNIYGIVQRDLGHYDSARTALQKSVQLYRSNDQENTGSYSKALRDLAYVERIQNNYDHASSLVREALNIERKLYEAPDVRIAETLYVLASILRFQDKFEEAIKVQKQSLDMVRSITNKPHPGIANNLVNLANLYDHQQKIQKARKYYQQGLVMNKKLHGDTHRSIANIHSSLSSGYLYEGKLDSAIFHFKKAREIQEQVDPDSKQMANILDNGAKVYVRLDQFSRTNTMLNKSKAILEDKFNPNHPELVDWKISKAKVERQQGDLSTAKALYREALKVRQQRYELSEKPVQEILRPLTNLLQASGQEAEADSLSQYIQNEASQ